MTSFLYEYQPAGASNGTNGSRGIRTNAPYAMRHGSLDSQYWESHIADVVLRRRGPGIGHS